MSKQSETKESQGWRKHGPTCGNCQLFTSEERKIDIGWRKHGPTCGNCQLFTSEERKIDIGFGTYVSEGNLRCSHGQFKTGKSSWCSSHKWREG